MNALDLWPIVVGFTPGANHLQIKVDDLIVEPIEALEGVHLIPGDGDVISLDDDSAIIGLRSVLDDLDHVLGQLRQFGLDLVLITFIDGHIGDGQTLANPVFQSLVDLGLALLSEKSIISYSRGSI